MSSTFRRRFLPRLTALAAALMLTGCATVAEDVRKDLLPGDFQALQEDHCLIENDLTLFRGCLKHRGGSCEGSGIPGEQQIISLPYLLRVQRHFDFNTNRNLLRRQPTRSAHSSTPKKVLQSFHESMSNFQ